MTQRNTTFKVYQKILAKKAESLIFPTKKVECLLRKILTGTDYKRVDSKLLSSGQHKPLTTVHSPKIDFPPYRITNWSVIGYKVCANLCCTIFIN